MAMSLKYTITKSDFQLFLDAPLHLWASKHGLISKPLSDFEVHIMNQGYKIEELAKRFLEILEKPVRFLYGTRHLRWVGIRNWQRFTRISAIS